MTTSSSSLESELLLSSSLSSSLLPPLLSLLDTIWLISDSPILLETPSAGLEAIIDDIAAVAAALARGCAAVPDAWSGFEVSAGLVCAGSMVVTG